MRSQGAVMSGNKKAPSRRGVKVEVEVPGSAQSAAARRSAESQLRTLIDTFAPTHQRLIGALRRSLRKRLATAHEVVYEYRNLGAVVISFSPNEHGYEGARRTRAAAASATLYVRRRKGVPAPRALARGASRPRGVRGRE